MQGIVFCHLALVNQRDEIVQEGEWKVMMARGATIEAERREGAAARTSGALTCQSRTNLRVPRAARLFLNSRPRHAASNERRAQSAASSGLSMTVSGA